MSAEILAFPKARPALRLVTDTPSVCSDHFQRELGAVAHHLHKATGHFGMIGSATIAELGISLGADELEAALFYALSLKGCLNDDRELRRLLAARQEKRDGYHG